MGVEPRFIGRIINSLPLTR